MLSTRHHYMKKEAKEMARQAFQFEIDSIHATKECMNWEAFAKAVEVLSKTERIATTGCGHSGIACMHFAHSLCCVERPARFISPSEALHGAIGYIQKGDVLIWASRGGRTDELTKIIDICHAKGGIIIGITENLSSLLAAKSDIVVPMKVTFETDKYNSQGTSSFTALAAVFDALQTAIIEEINYKNEQFALIHPAGAVGKRLNQK